MSVVLEISRKRSFPLTIPTDELEFTRDNYLIASIKHAEKIAKKDIWRRTRKLL